MKNSNILIISVAIVLLIAGGVTAYQFINPESNIINLPAFTTNDEYGSDDISKNSEDGKNNGSGIDNPPSNGSSGSPYKSNVGNTGFLQIVKNAEDAKKVAEEYINETGCYPGTPKWDNKQKMWIVKVYDTNDKEVDTIGVETNGNTNRV